MRKDRNVRSKLRFFWINGLMNVIKQLNESIAAVSLSFDLGS